MNKNTRTRFNNKPRVRTGDTKVISQNHRRNLQMVVEKGSDEDGKKFSQTFHVKIHASEPSYPKPRRDNKKRKPDAVAAE